jgi:hypothetical protein
VPDDAADTDGDGIADAAQEAEGTGDRSVDAGDEGARNEGTGLVGADPDIGESDSDSAGSSSSSGPTGGLLDGLGTTEKAALAGTVVLGVMIFA